MPDQPVMSSSNEQSDKELDASAKPQNEEVANCHVRLAVDEADSSDPIEVSDSFDTFLAWTRSSA
jgi:hypothetical protein